MLLHNNLYVNVADNVVQSVSSLDPGWVKHAYGVSAVHLSKYISAQNKGNGCWPRRDLLAASGNDLASGAARARGSFSRELTVFQWCLIEAYFILHSLAWKGLESGIKLVECYLGFSPDKSSARLKNAVCAGIMNLCASLTASDLMRTFCLHKTDIRRVFRLDVLLSARTKFSNVEPYLDMHARVRQGSCGTEVRRRRVARK